MGYHSKQSFFVLKILGMIKEKQSLESAVTLPRKYYTQEQGPLFQTQRGITQLTLGTLTL